jgi:putative transposase
MASERVFVSEHIIQRGRVDCFSCAEERLAYLDRATVLAAHYECAVHAYALMANHVHLLLTCPSQQRSVELARALWHAEPELRPIHARRYLLACMRYIELNPVRASIVARPESYRWSSYRANALGYIDPIVTPHPLYYALGRSPDTRRAAYARFVRSGFPRPDRVSP